MRNYQRQKNNVYKLPHNLYMRILYLIRDYERIKSERDNVLYSTSCSDGQPHAPSISSPTEAKGIKLYEIGNRCRAVEEALQSIPQEYRQVVWSNICYQSPYPIIAGEATCKRWRSRLIYEVAKNLHEI